MPRSPGRWIESLALALAGAVQSLALVETRAWILPVLSLALLVWRLDRSPGLRRAAWLAWVHASAGLAAAVWWLFISMHTYGHLPAWMAAAAVGLLSAGLSLYGAAAAALYVRLRRGQAGVDTLLFATLWLAAELARGQWLTGFPWAASGYTQVDSPLAALAPWVGVYGIGAVLAGLAVLVARAGQGRWRWPVPAAAGVLVALALAGPGEFTQPGRPLRVKLLQTNVPQDEKFAAERMPQVLQWVARELTTGDADLVVAPETAVPLLPGQLAELAPGYWEGLREHFAGGTRAALIGLPLGDYDRGYTNSVAGLSRQAAALPGGFYRYDKLHLVPFGEFIPWGFRWFTELMNIPLGDFMRGVPNPPSFEVQGERAAPNICYEDLFGEELALRFADAARAPTLMVNVSNIGWFGDTIAVAQHLNISRLRALEFQRPMLRATNTGATAVIDHRGRVTARLAAFRTGTLDATVEGRRGTTPYAAWVSRTGWWPGWLLVAGVLLVLRRAARTPA